MNPDEGDLRPQLSDRFAHGVVIRDDFRPEQRIEIVKRRIAFDDDPEKFMAGYALAMSELASRIALARRQITKVYVSDDQRMAVAANGRELKLEGLRAELAVVRTARCAAAIDDRSSVKEQDLQEAWRLCLGHRHTVQSGAPKPPSSAPEMPRPSFGNRSTETSSAPLGSRPDPKVLGLFQPRSHFQFLNWVHGRAAALASDRGLQISRKVLVRAPGPITWLETLMVSIRSGWLDNLGPMRLQYRLPSTRANFWCFLDASRSTGMNQFLDAARNVLAGVPSRIKSARFHLVVLAAGEIRWETRNASLASPAPGENPTESLARLQQILRRLTRTGTPCAWIHPTAKRGLRRWIPELLRGLPFVRFEV
jgi:hypothetical protein